SDQYQPYFAYFRLHDRQNFTDFLHVVNLENHLGSYPLAADGAYRTKLNPLWPHHRAGRCLQAGVTGSWIVHATWTGASQNYALHAQDEAFVLSGHGFLLDNFMNYEKVGK